jgi:hypothetical protein
MGASRRIVIGCLALVAPVALFAAWFYEGENFSSRAVSGTYTVQFHNGSSTLILNPDRTFRQQVDEDGAVSLGEGTWRVVGEGHIAFSGRFVVLPGQEIYKPGTVYAQIVNRFGFVTIKLNQEAGPPTYHKQWFH